MRTIQTLFLLSGPRSIGGTYNIEKLVTEFPNHFQEIRSATTRPIRENDPNDPKRYRFLTKEDFLKRKERGEFLETDEYRNEYYGTLISEMTDISCPYGIIKVTPRGILPVQDTMKKFGILAYVLFLTPHTDDVLIKNLQRKYPGIEYKKIQSELDEAGVYIKEMKKTTKPDYEVFMTGLGNMDYHHLCLCLRVLGAQF